MKRIINNILRLACLLYPLFPVLYVAVAVLLVYIILNTGVYPVGTETMEHLYRGNVVYRSLAEGNVIPGVDLMRMGGIEIFRSYSPVSSYVIALCEALAGGDVINGYFIFTGLMYFLSACVWFVIGQRRKRPLLGAFLGLFWFLMPYQLDLLLGSGNLSRVMAVSVLTPLYLHCLTLTGQEKNIKYFIGVAGLQALIVLTDFSYAGMLVIASAVFVLVELCFNEKQLKVDAQIVGVICGWLVSGFWLVPCLLSGSIARHAGADAEVKASFQSLWQSLNPLQRLNENHSLAYFGLSVLIVLIFILLFGKRKDSTKATTGIILLSLTTTFVYYVVQLLPGNSHLRMTVLFAPAIAFTFLAFLDWNSLRTRFSILFCILLLLDLVPSLKTLQPNQNVYDSTSSRYEAMMTTTLISTAQEITEHRLAILDEGNLGSEGLYLASDYQKPVPIINGYDRNQSDLAPRLRYLSRALCDGNYRYVFDRCLELGCDSIIIDATVVDYTDIESGYLVTQANALGYELYEENDHYQLYHRDLGKNWGIVSEYPAIGIGTTAIETSFWYPAMEETDDTNLNHYTFEQLKKYDTILLSGFTYDDQESAEDLILRLSESGVRILIAADGIPLDNRIHERNFLGVRCNNITFSNGYPEMNTIVGLINTDLFPADYATWETVYVEGLDEVWGTALDNDVQLPFYGTVKNENIIVVGLNLNFYYSLTRDKSIERLLSNELDVQVDTLAERNIVPLNIEVNHSQITIQSNQNNVNTTMTGLDCYMSSETLMTKNKQLYVSSGTTVISIIHPYLAIGVGMSVVGIVLAALYFIRWHKKDQIGS